MDEQEKQRRANAKAARARRAIIMETREKLDVDAIRQQIDALPAKLANDINVRPWLDAIRAGLSALGEPPALTDEETDDGG